MRVYFFFFNKLFNNNFNFIELSEVLWNMVFINAMNLQDGNIGIILLYLGFFMFALLTFSVLVMMEGLSAFLHALRLHW